MKSLALSAAIVLAFASASAEGGALRLGNPEWEWLNEPLDINKAEKLEQACRMQFAGPWFGAGEERLLAAWAYNQDCFSRPSYSLFLFRLDEDGRAVARLRAVSGGFYLRCAIDARGLIDFSRRAVVAPKEMPLFPRFAFDSPKPGPSN